MTTRSPISIIMTVSFLAWAGAARAQQTQPARAATTKAETETLPPVTSEPQETSAIFGDWTVRCVTPAASAPKHVCEVAQAVTVQGQQAPIAQIAFAAETGSGYPVTVVLPTNVTLDKPPRLAPGPDDEHEMVLTFRRCFPGACAADGKIDHAALKPYRDATKPGRLVFTDASGRALTLPISYRGLAQALERLAKETAAR